MLNVSRGGTLHQHLPDLEPETGERVEHRQTEPGEAVTHTVKVDRGTRLHELLGKDEVEVNSFHHQAVDRLGRDLVATAHAPDGVIEGLEIPGHPFAVGVQWHAECLVDRDDHLRLFEGLTDAARDYRGSGRRGLRAA